MNPDALLDFYRQWNPMHRELVEMKDKSSLIEMEKGDIKPDHSSRPVFVYPDGRLILEAFSSIAGEAADFLITIAEPVSRPTFVQEFKITEYSLYAAVSIGLDYNHIISVLDSLSKTPVPDSLCQYISKHTRAFGKVQLVRKQGNFFLETSDNHINEILTGDSIINSCRIVTEPLDEYDKLLFEDYDMLFDDLCMPKIDTSENQMEKIEEFKGTESNIVIETQLMPEIALHEIPITKTSTELVKKHCFDLQLPIIEEYDFKNDQATANLNIKLKTFSKLRDYQEKSLSKMFGNGRARSGIIVLPCGSGKTLVGVSAACTVQKPCLVLCTSSFFIISIY